MGGWLIANDAPTAKGVIHQRDLREDLRSSPLRRVVIVGRVAQLLRLEKRVSDAMQMASAVQLWPLWRIRIYESVALAPLFV